MTHRALVLAGCGGGCHQRDGGRPASGAPATPIQRWSHLFAPCSWETYDILITESWTVPTKNMIHRTMTILQLTMDDATTKLWVPTIVLV